MMELTFHYKMSDPLQISAQSTFTIYHLDQISQFPLSQKESPWHYIPRDNICTKAEEIFTIQ